MTVNEFSLLVGSVGGAASALIAAIGYRQKARGLRAETDVRLVKAFADLVPLANARGPAVLSEAAAAKLAEQTYDNDVARASALRAALLVSPIGAQTQVSVLQAVATLGCEHPILREAARAAVVAAEVTPNLEDQKASALKRLRAHEGSWWQEIRH
jgi:hypothetical protein